MVDDHMNLKAHAGFRTPWSMETFCHQKSRKSLTALMYQAPRTCNAARARLQRFSRCTGCAGGCSSSCVTSWERCRYV
jgi:hypothetical protein